MASSSSRHQFSHENNPVSSASSDLHLDTTPSSGIPLDTQSRKRRGKTKYNLTLPSPSEGKIPIECNSFGQPVCANYDKLQNFLGALARNCDLCPVGYDDWRHIPKSYKEKQIQLVLEAFSFNTEIREAERMILKSLGKRWRDYKCELRREHFKSDQSLEENCLNTPPGVDPEEWERLVAYFLSTKGKGLSERGKQLRGSQVLRHTTGRKSFARLRQELIEERGHEVGLLELFEETHTRKGTGRLDDAASAVAETVRKKVAEKQEVEASNDGPDLLNLEREAFAEILGPDPPGRVRGHGFGVTKSMLLNAFSDKQNSEVADLKRKVEHLTTIDEEKDKRIKKMEEEMAILKQFILSSQGGWSATEVSSQASSSQD